MRIAFLVNRVETEIDEYTTTRLAKAAALMGHEIWYVGVGDLTIGEPDGEIGAHARPGIAGDEDTLTAFLDRMKESTPEGIRMDRLDAVFLRNDSIEDLHDRPWASSFGAIFGDLLAKRGVTVVNDPTVLMRAATKVYLDEFPAEIRPRSLMTRNEDDVRDFVSAVGRSIIKPLCGAKGRNVFMVDGADEPNLNQIMEAVLEDGYIYAQGYVDGAEDGDMRIFLLDGELIEVDGHVAAFQRVPEGNDPRANISTGGKMQPGQITEHERVVVEALHDKLVEDGMFFVGIDVIGDKVVEINTESPGGLQAIERLYGVDICPVVIDALERRTRTGPATPGFGTPTTTAPGISPQRARQQPTGTSVRRDATDSAPPLRVAVIAHRKKSIGGGLDELRKLIADEGFDDPVWHEVSKSRKARKRARRTLKDGVDLVLVWGGDGMVQRCVDGLAGSDAAVAIIPAGTANMLAGNLGIPTDLPEAVRIAFHGSRRRLDLGKLNGEHFAVMAGAGFDAEMINDADRGFKDRAGRLAYVLTGLRHVRDEPVPTTIRVDGRKWFDGPATCVLFGNVGTITGGICAFDDARPDDGLLDVGVATAQGALQWARTLGRAATGRSERSPFIEMTQGRVIDVKFAKKLTYELDGGERETSKRLQASIVPAALTFCVPED